MKYIFIIFFSFCGLFFNNGLKAAEKINIKFEEMEIPLTIEQLSKLEKYKDDSTELIDWLKKNNLIDFYIVKEGEIPFVKLIEQLVSKKFQLEDVKKSKVPSGLTSVYES